MEIQVLTITLFICKVHHICEGGRVCGCVVCGWVNYGAGGTSIEVCTGTCSLTQSQGVVIPIGAIVTAVTGVKKRSRGQGLFLVSVKRSRTIFKLGNSSQDINILRVCIVHSVVKCVWSNGQGPICGVVKRSSNKNDGQNFFTPVATVTIVPIGVITP